MEGYGAIQLLFARLHSQKGRGGQIHLERGAIDEPLVTPRRQATARGQVMGDETQTPAPAALQRRQIEGLWWRGSDRRGLRRRAAARSGGQRAGTDQEVSAIHLMRSGQAADMP